MAQSSKVVKYFGEVYTPATPNENAPNIVPLTSGSTITIPSNVVGTIGTAGSTLASLTVNLPPTPANQQTVFFSCGVTITAFTVSGNGNTVKPTYSGALPAGVSVRYIFDKASSCWYQI